MQLFGGRNRSVGRPYSNTLFNWLNFIGVAYFWGTTILISYLVLAIYIPTAFEQYPWEIRKNTRLSWFFIAEVVVNYFMVYMKKSHYNHQQSRAITNSKWSNCLDCQAPKPPRAHHCPSCKKCILKRDHHCFLTNTCIGFQNQRYLAVLSLYCFAASIFSLLMSYNYLTVMHGFPLSKDHWYHYILPVAVFEWIFGEQGYDFIFHLSIFYLLAVTAFAALTMAVMQHIFPFVGLTQKDYTSGIVPDFQRVRLMDNWHETFGYYYILNLLIPMPFLKQRGDGIHIPGEDEDDKLRHIY